MTYPVGTTPTDAYDNTNFAAYAATTQSEWEDSIDADLTSQFEDAEDGAGNVVPNSSNGATNAQAALDMIDDYVTGSTSTVTAAGTTTLTTSSKVTQVFTGSTTQTVTLPTTSIVAGRSFTIINQSTGTVTVQSSGANTVSTLTGAADPSAVVCIALQNTPTTAAHWKTL